MKTPAALLVVLFAAAATSAFANPDLAKKKLCTGCHDVANKGIGPAFKDVAAKYAGQKEVVDKLAQKVMKGGAGSWGPLPMPANTQVTEAEAKQLVQWIMTLK